MIAPLVDKVNYLHFYARTRTLTPKTQPMVVRENSRVEMAPKMFNLGC